jgi:hypothetical protein
VIFHETIQGLQVIQLKLDKIPADSLKKKIFINEEGKGSVQIKMLPHKEIGATIDIVKTRLRDS